MGLVIRIWAHGYYERIYFVQDLDEKSAKEKAFRMFKQTMNCRLPDTLEEAEKQSEVNDDFWIEVVAEVEQIIL